MVFALSLNSHFMYEFKLGIIKLQNWIPNPFTIEIVGFFTDISN